MNNHSQFGYTENQLSKIILDTAFKVHSKTGPGLLETVYEVLLAHDSETGSSELSTGSRKKRPPALVPS